MEIVTLREFSRRIGVSLTAIQKGVRTGRIQAIKDDSGKITGIDYDSQKDAWTDNSKAPQRMPKTIAGGRPRDDGAPTAKPATATAAKRQAQPKSEQQQQSGTSLAEIQRARELVKLQLDNLKLKEAQGELVPAAEVRKQGHALATGIVSVLYNIPERCADEMAGMTDPHAIHKLLVSEIDQAIEKIRSVYGS